MDELKIKQLFEKLFKNDEFREKYLRYFLDRFVYSTTDLEDESKRKENIEKLLEAFKLLQEKDYKISTFDIRDVGDIIGRDEGIEGFRRTYVSPGKYATWEVSPAREIIPRLYSLFNDYYKVWDIRPVYEREAAFHIQLIRIHPFQDGNKRVAKLLLAFNLIKQGYPPVIINESETELYYDFINNEKVDDFEAFLKNKSIEELSDMISLYKLNYDIPITENIKEPDDINIVK